MNRYIAHNFFAAFFVASITMLGAGITHAQVQPAPHPSTGPSIQSPQHTPLTTPQAAPPSVQNAQSMPAPTPNSDARRQELTRQIERRRQELQRKQLIREHRNDMMRRQ